MPLEGHPDRYMTWRGIRYADVEGSPEGNFAYDRGTIPRNIYVSWEQFNDTDVTIGVNDAVTAFMGRSDVFQAANGARVVTRLIPHQFPTRPWMYVQQVTHTKPMGMRAAKYYADMPGDPPTVIGHGTGNKDDGTGLARYAQVEIGLQYVMPVFKIKDDTHPYIVNPESPSIYYGLPDEGYAIGNGLQYSRYVSRHIKRMSKMLTIGRGLLKRSDGKRILEAVAITEHVATYEYTWHQVPEEALPVGQWILAANTVNQFDFDGQPAGTLLFAGDPEVRHEPNPITGQHLYSVKYTFHSLRIVDASVDPPVVRGHNWVRVVSPVGKLVAMFFSTNGGDFEDEKIFRNFDFRNFFRPVPVTS